MTDRGFCFNFNQTHGGQLQGQVGLPWVPHATGITAYLEAGGILETPQRWRHMEARIPRSSRDCTCDEITLDEVGRIAI